MPATLNRVAIRILLVIAAIAIAYLLGTGGGTYISHRRDQSLQRELRSNQTRVLLAEPGNIAVGKTLPNGFLPTIAGDSVQLFDLFKQKSLVSIISSGCPNCIAQIQDIVQAGRDSTDDECVIFISYAGIEELKGLQEHSGLKSFFLHDADSQYETLLLDMFIFPTNIIVDQRGTILEIVAGGLTEDEVRDIMKFNRQ